MFYSSEAVDVSYHKSFDINVYVHKVYPCTHSYRTFMKNFRFIDEIANPMTSLISRNQIEDLIHDVVMSKQHFPIMS